MSDHHGAIAYILAQSALLSEGLIVELVSGDSYSHDVDSGEGNPTES